MTYTTTQRNKAYAIAPYPGFGLWGFARIHLLASDPRYHLAIARLTAPGSTDAVLDLGCGLGQNIRQFAHAGVAPEKLFAVDLRQDLMELGFDAFGDRERLRGATFAAGDVLKDDDEALKGLDGRVSIVHAANFFHLFGWDAQIAAGVRVAKFLEGRAEDVFIFGRQVGSVTPGKGRLASMEKPDGVHQFLHDQESFERLWDEVGEMTGTKWKVEVDMLGPMPAGYAYMGESARYSRFAIWRM